MAASLLYRLEAAEAERNIARGLAVVEHPGQVSHVSLGARVRRLWSRASSRRSEKTG